MRWPDTLSDERRLAGKSLVAVVLLLLASLVPLVDALLGGRMVGDPADTILVAVAGYLIGAWTRPTPASAASLVAAATLTSANQVAHPGQYSAPNDLFFFAVMIGGAALAGALVTARSRQVRELRALSRLRAEQRAAELLAAHLAERDRIDAAVTDSMLRRLSALVTLATQRRPTAESRQGEAPGSVPELLRQVEELARSTLDDLRTALGSLRLEDEPEAVAEPLPASTPEPPMGVPDVLVACSGIPLALELAANAPTFREAIADVVASLALGGLLLARRSKPLTTATAVFAIALAMTAWLTPLTSTVSVLLPLSLLAYALGAHIRGLRRLVGVGVLLLGGAAVSLAGPAADRHSDGLLPTLVWVSVAFTAGVVAAQQTLRARILVDLLERVETGSGAQLRLAVAQERQAIARDLHDSVAHAMTIVCLHSAAGQRADSAHAAASLEVIGSAVRDAMKQLRSGLESLDHDALVQECRDVASSLGLQVEMEVAEGPWSLGADESVVARRVVREALVNVSRHAPGSRPTVRLLGESHELLVEVTNDCAGPAYALGSGTGLLGLGELVALYGGRLEHGVSGGRFRVAALLPVRADAVVEVPA